MSEDKGWSANKIAVLGVAVGVCLSIIGVTAVRLFGHDEPTFLAQIALAGISGLVGFATGHAVRTVRPPAAVTPKPEPSAPQPATLPPPAPPVPARQPTGGPDLDRHLRGLAANPPRPAASVDELSVDDIIRRHSTGR